MVYTINHIKGIIVAFTTLWVYKNGSLLCVTLTSVLRVNPNYCHANLKEDFKVIPVYACAFYFVL